MLPLGSKGTSCCWQENPAAVPGATTVHSGNGAPLTNAPEILPEMPWWKKGRSGKIWKWDSPKIKMTRKDPRFNEVKHHPWKDVTNCFQKTPSHSLSIASLNQIKQLYFKTACSTCAGCETWQQHQFQHIPQWSVKRLLNHMSYLHKWCWKELKQSNHHLINADLCPDEWTPDASPAPNFEICVIIHKDKSLPKILLGNEHDQCKHYGQDKGQDPALFLH